MKTATHYIDVNVDHGRAEKILIKLIKINSLSECGYVLLLELYIKTQSVTKYCHTFKKYALMMKSDLNIDPEKRFRAHFIKIMESQGDNQKS